MKNGALVAFIAWQLVLTESTPQMIGEHPRSLSKIQLLIPLMMSGTNHANDASDASNESDRDMPFSSIPSNAFTLDEGPPAPPPSLGHMDSYAPDLYWPRSIYLGSAESSESSSLSLDVELRRLCSRRGPELLRVLCAELLDAPPAPAAPAAPAACECCGRRDLMPMGGNADGVLRYMRSSRKKPRPSMPQWNDE